MHWSDASIILSSRKYGESSAVVRVLAREHGVFAGVVRSANSKNNRGIVQAGNVVSSQWQARLSQQLGTFKLELLEAHAAHIMQDEAKLAALSSACTITEMALPERHPYPKLFLSLHEFLHTLTASDHWQQDYVKYELSVLAESGFGLDLSECAATGVTEDLIYASPKSGRAACREAGEPYKDKLLPLPEFLLSGHGSRVMGHGDLTHDSGLMTHDYLKEILAGMQLTGYFLEHSLLAPHGKKLPAARIRLQNILQELNATEIVQP